MATSAGESAVIDRSKPEKQTRGQKIARGPIRPGPPLSGRALVQHHALRLARNWRARRGLLVRDLDPIVRDALRDWSEARARLEIADEGQRPDRWITAAQNSTSRLLRALEASLREHPPLPSLLSRRYR
jgi:hypothetical protein